jgi:NADPH-dependent 2,4-dienoyl-CoA reductase/sulfur reductase-like enzyme/rhodanese-related sulfurtransferase/anti-sigma regulatory factor (Ser/Thr protein kinase)
VPEKKEREDAEQSYLRVLSHQLKSPIHAIQSLLKTITEGFTGSVNPRALHLIGRAANRASQAEEMITDLLDYQLYSQQKEAAKSPKEEFDITALLNSLSIRYISQASERDVSLRSELPLETRVLVLGDSRSMEHAIRNIIENAIKYTPAQGRVTVELSYRESEKRCLIRVSDTGYGIKESELESIFDPFYRSIKHRANISGTGLGLPIAKTVITSHGGTITAQSEENVGTTFEITLPLARVLQKKDQKTDRTRVVIIGGVTAGPKAAARLRRLNEELDITIVEKSEFLSYSGCGIPYYIAGRVNSPRALMSTADHTMRDVHFFEAIKNINTLNNTMAVAIDRGNKRIKIRELKTGKTSYLPYDKLILATGAVPDEPAIPGLDQEGIFSLYRIEDAEAIKRELAGRNAPDVFIIGGGLIGVESAESLMVAGARVTILERESCILNTMMDRDVSTKIQNELHRKGIKIVTGVRIRTIKKEKRHLSIVADEDLYRADLVILCTGVKPNNSLAKEAGLELGESEGVKVNRYLQTSDEDIYAVGDCAESINLVTKHHEYWPLGSISTKMGRIVADNIAGREREFNGSIGTAMLRAFNINIARTGLTTERAAAAGFDVETSLINGLDKAHYCENAEYVTLKVIADRETRRILGAQGYGRGDIVSKIGIFACAVTLGLTLAELFKLDLGYSPPFNSPIDITQTACLVLDNKIDGLFKTITLEEFKREKTTVGIVDVSPLSEHTLGSIPGSVNVPLENIRREEIPFDRDEKVVLYSKTSSGAYEASMYLSSRGYSKLHVLEGGYLHWAG